MTDAGEKPSYETLDWTIQDRILTLTLARPDRLNAFTVTMCEELERAFSAAGSDDRIGAIVVTGAGHTFCAGMDLGVDGNVFGLDEEASPTLDEVRRGLHDPAMLDGVRDTGGRVALAIFACPKPVVAAVNGAAVGIGATMTLPMDFRLASNEARFGFVFGRLGIVPEACSSWFLPRLVGIPKALEWTYRADIITAGEALAAGLVQSLHPPDQLLTAAREFAALLIDQRSPLSITLIRQMLWRNSALSHPAEAHAIESLAMLETSRLDGKEGVAAFREKRPPVFAATPRSLSPSLRAWLDHGYDPTGT